MVSIIALSISVLVIFLAYYFFQKRRKSPPGPWGLPIFGNLLSLHPQMHLSFEKWAKQYGSIVKIRLGSFDAVILDDIKIIREAFSKPAFSGRPDLKLFNFIAGGKHGLSNSEGEEWAAQRRFALKNLRDLGFGKKSMESLIMDEVNDVLGWMKDNDGKAVSVNRKFSLAVVNALLTITMGKRFDQEDPVLKKMIDNAQEVFIEATKSGFLWFMPNLTSFFPQILGWEKLEAIAEPFKGFFNDILKLRFEATKDGTDSKNFTDAYFEEIKNTKDPNSSFYKEAGHKSLLTVILDLFGAGSGTTTTTLAWLILYLMTHPEVQQKLQAELDTITDKKRAPCLADKANTPYAEAIVQETLRMSSIIPYGVFHSVMEDVEFHGYSIAKDTIIIPNLHAVHHDVKIWGDPENFRPERFLTDDGKAVKRSEHMVPFSIGKRVCVGESMARDQIYLFLTNIFHKFTAIPDPVDPKPSLEPEGSFTLEAKNYTVIFKERI